MKFYPEVAKAQGLSSDEILKNGTWSLYCDVKCIDCGRELAVSQVGGFGGKCPKCGGEMR